MKISKLIVTSAVAAAASLVSLQAGVAPAPMPAPVAPAADGVLADYGITGQLSSGFDSRYMFRGVDLGKDAIWTGLDLSMPLTDGVGLGIGTWYVNPTEQSGDNDITDELDFYISLGTTIGAFDVAIGHTWYYYPESREGDIQDDTNELFVSLGTEVGGIAVGAVYAYDMDLETHYTEVSLGYGMAISDVVALEASVNVGFLDENYAHSTFSLGVPVALTGSATLTPYVAAVFPTDDRDIVTHAPEFADLYEGDDEVIGGVSLSVSF